MGNAALWLRGKGSTSGLKLMDCPYDVPNIFEIFRASYFA